MLSKNAKIRVLCIWEKTLESMIEINLRSIELYEDGYEIINSSFIDTKEKYLLTLIFTKL